MEFKTSSINDDFKIEKGSFASGGFGVLFNATKVTKHSSNISSKFAIKRFLITGNGSLYDQYIQEKASLKKIHSSKIDRNLLPIYTIYENNPYAYYVMDKCKCNMYQYGKELKKNDKNYHKLYDFGKQIIGGITAIHEMGMIHRDIKPQNLLLTADDVIKITDYGNTKIVDFSQLDINSKVPTAPYLDYVQAAFTLRQCKSIELYPIYGETWSTAATLFSLFYGAKYYERLHVVTLKQEREYPASYHIWCFYQYIQEYYGKIRERLDYQHTILKYPYIKVILKPLENMIEIDLNTIQNAYNLIKTSNKLNNINIDDKHIINTPWIKLDQLPEEKIKLKPCTKNEKELLNDQINHYLKSILNEQESKRDHDWNSISDNGNDEINVMLNELDQIEHEQAKSFAKQLRNLIKKMGTMTLIGNKGKKKNKKRKRVCIIADDGEDDECDKKSKKKIKKRRLNRSCK